MKGRIKELRKSLNLTQAEFGKRIGLASSSVANYELGRNGPTDAIIASMCREYRISEDWLRYGEGEMFQPMTRAEEVTSMLGSLIADDPQMESFKSRVIAAALKVGPDGWKVFEEFFNDLAK